MLPKLAPSQPAPCYPDYNARENSLQLSNPDKRNLPSNPEPKGPLVQIDGGYFCKTPYILDKCVPKSWFTPPPLPPIRTPRPPKPTLLRRPPDRRPAGDSSPTMSSTATARRPSSTTPDEDPLSISSSHRINRPVLHRHCGHHCPRPSPTSPRAPSCPTASPSTTGPSQEPPQRARRPLLPSSLSLC